MMILGIFYFGLALNQVSGANNVVYSRLAERLEKWNTGFASRLFSGDRKAQSVLPTSVSKAEIDEAMRQITKVHEGEAIPPDFAHGLFSSNGMRHVPNSEFDLSWVGGGSSLFLVGGNALYHNEESKALNKGFPRVYRTVSTYASYNSKGEVKEYNTLLLVDPLQELFGENSVTERVVLRGDNWLRGFADVHDRELPEDSLLLYIYHNVSFYWNDILMEMISCSTTVDYIEEDEVLGYNMPCEANTSKFVIEELLGHNTRIRHPIFPGIVSPPGTGDDDNEAFAGGDSVQQDSEMIYVHRWLQTKLNELLGAGTSEAIDIVLEKGHLHNGLGDDVPEKVTISEFFTAVAAWVVGVYVVLMKHRYGHFTNWFDWMLECLLLSATLFPPFFMVFAEWNAKRYEQGFEVDLFTSSTVCVGPVALNAFVAITSELQAGTCGSAIAMTTVFGVRTFHTDHALLYTSILAICVLASLGAMVSPAFHQWQQQQQPNPAGQQQQQQPNPAGQQQQDNIL